MCSMYVQQAKILFVANFSKHLFVGLDLGLICILIMKKKIAYVLNILNTGKMFCSVIWKLALSKPFQVCFSS